MTSKEFMELEDQIGLEAAIIISQDQLTEETFAQLPFWTCVDVCLGRSYPLSIRQAALSRVKTFTCSVEVSLRVLERIGKMIFVYGVTADDRLIGTELNQYAGRQLAENAKTFEQLQVAYYKAPRDSDSEKMIIEKLRTVKATFKQWYDFRHGISSEVEEPSVMESIVINRMISAAKDLSDWSSCCNRTMVDNPQYRKWWEKSMQGIIDLATTVAEWDRVYSNASSERIVKMGWGEKFRTLALKKMVELATSLYDLRSVYWYLRVKEKLPSNDPSRLEVLDKIRTVEASFNELGNNGMGVREGSEIDMVLAERKIKQAQTVEELSKAYIAAYFAFNEPRRAEAMQSVLDRLVALITTIQGWSKIYNKYNGPNANDGAKVLKLVALEKIKELSLVPAK